MNKTIAAIYERLEHERSKARSAWSKGVVDYAFDLLEGLEEHIDGGYFTEEDIASRKLLEKEMLNGAKDWKQYSWGGCSLIYNSDIAKRLCTPSELARCHGGERRPNKDEEWLDTQARALFLASLLIQRIVKELV